MQYGKGMTIGTDATDTICLTPESTFGNGCMGNFHFRLVHHQEDLQGLAGAGLIGLAPSGIFDDAQLFVPSLYE